MNIQEPFLPFIQSVISRYYGVSDQSLEKLHKLAEVKHLERNEILLPLGKIAKSVYILYQGALIAYFLDNEGNTYHKNIFLEGQWVGSTVSYLTQTPSNFELQAIEESTLLRFNYAKFRQLIFDNNDLMRFYIAYLETNWVVEKEKREVALVMKEAKDRYLALLHQHPGLDQRIPLNYIASHLGITPTQLSRIRKNLKK